MLQHKNSDSEKKNLPLSLDLGPSDVLKTINTNRSESTITHFVVHTIVVHLLSIFLATE